MDKELISKSVLISSFLILLISHFHLQQAYNNGQEDLMNQHYQYFNLIKQAENIHNAHNYSKPDYVCVNYTNDYIAKYGGEYVYDKNHAFVRTYVYIDPTNNKIMFHEYTDYPDPITKVEKNLLTCKKEKEILIQRCQ